MQVSFDGDTLELNKLTLVLSDEMDACSEQKTAAKMYEAEFKFLSHAVIDGIAPYVDGDTYKTCDLVRLQTLFVQVVNAYQAPIIEAQKQNIEEQLAGLDDKVDQMGKMLDLSEKAKKTK